MDKFMILLCKSVFADAPPHSFLALTKCQENIPVDCLDREDITFLEELHFKNRKEKGYLKGTFSDVSMIKNDPRHLEYEEIFNGDENEMCELWNKALQLAVKINKENIQFISMFEALPPNTQNCRDAAEAILRTLKQDHSRSELSLTWHAVSDKLAEAMKDISALSCSSTVVPNASLIRQLEQR